MEYYSATKVNKHIGVSSNEVDENLESKDKYHILTHIFGIWKYGTEELIYRAAIEKQT